MDDSRQSSLKLVAEIGKTLNLLEEDAINTILRAVASEINAKIHFILLENQKDLQRIESNHPNYNKIVLSPERVAKIVLDINQIADIPSPNWKKLETKTTTTGLKATKIKVPFGVIAIDPQNNIEIIFNTFALSFKTGNACIIKASLDTKFSDSAIIDIIQNTLDANGVNPNICTILPTEEFPKLDKEQLVNFKFPNKIEGEIALLDLNIEHSNESQKPISHIYFHNDGDIEKGKEVVSAFCKKEEQNADYEKWLIVHKDRLEDVAYICKELSKSHINIYADKLALELLSNHYPKDLLHSISSNNYEKNGNNRIFIKTVWGLEDAIKHIGENSAKKIEVIVAENNDIINKFNKLIEANYIFANIVNNNLLGELPLEVNSNGKDKFYFDELQKHKWLLEKTEE